MFYGRSLQLKLSGDRDVIHSPAVSIACGGETDGTEWDIGNDPEEAVVTASGVREDLAEVERVTENLHAGVVVAVGASAGSDRAAAVTEGSGLWARAASPDSGTDRAKARHNAEARENVVMAVLFLGCVSSRETRTGAQRYTSRRRSPSRGRAAAVGSAASYSAERTLTGQASGSVALLGSAGY